MAAGFDVNLASTACRRIAPDLIVLLFGPRNTPQEAMVTRTQMTRPPKSGFAEPGE
jgi:hypothetical protein